MNIKCNLCAGSPEIPQYEIQKSNDRTIKIDICIGKEVEYLIKQGVATGGCCCGHGSEQPSCLVYKESKDLLIKLGYKIEQFMNTDLLIINLKTDVQCELLKVLEQKTWRYKGE